MSWRIAVRHRTGYQYGSPARASYNEVRMTPAHLRDQPVRHIAHVERPPLFGDHGMKQDLEEHVPQLLAHLRVIALANRFVELVGFFDQIGPERVVRLVRIPLASSPQIAHERERIFKR